MDKKTYEYNCVNCDFYTDIKQLYDRHINTNKHKNAGVITRNDKKYPEKCDQCNYKPTSNRSYIQHKLIYHSTKEEREKGFKFYCSNCDFGTYAKTFFDDHLNSEKHNKMSK